MFGLPRRQLAAVALSLSHQTTYSPDEEIAFRHVRKYLADHDTYVIIPRSHPVEYAGFRSARFPDRYFGSPHAHAELLLSERFYRAFEAYEFVLIYHLDALVFADRLAEWCRAGYDFIGAPWLISPDTPYIKAEKVGNGGFSLRRVQSFLRVLRSNRYFVEPDEYWQNYARRTDPVIRVLNMPRKLLKRLPALNGVRWHRRWALKGDVHEDRFWAEFATRYDPDFRIAPVDVAMRFAFEAEPRACFRKIGNQLPFGAHRWARFDRAFYEPLLIQEGIGSGVRPASGNDSPSTLEIRMAHQ